MRPRLIIDFGDRTIFALLVTPDGELLPCSQEVRQVTTRYFSTEILFDPKESERPDFFWEEALAPLAAADSRTLFARMRRLGVRRPWEFDSPAEALRLPSPLAVLSSPAALVDPLVKAVLPGVGVALLAGLLEPVFAAATSRGVSLQNTEAIVVVASSTSLQARRALYKVLRRCGFPQLTLLPREIAAGMVLAAEPPPEYCVWDMMGDDLHLHRVAVESWKEVRRFRTVTTRTIRGLGWPYWVQQVATALASTQRTDSSRLIAPSLDRALMGLLGGSHDSTEVPATPPLRLTHDLLNETFAPGQFPELAPEVHGLVRPVIEELSAVGLPTILLGAICGLERMEALFLALSEASQPPAVAQRSSLERTAYGVADLLLWLRAAPGRRFEIPPSGSLRLNTLHGDTCELLTAEQLPSPGEHGHFQRSFHFAGSPQPAETFLLHLLWGADIAPEGNATLCTIPLELEPQVRGNGDLCLSLDLLRSRSGRRLTAHVEARLGRESTSQAWLPVSFANNLTESLSPPKS
jgi:hypothetical protein